MGGINIGWMVGCLGFEPRLAQSQTGSMRLLCGAKVKPPRLGWGGSGPCPDFASYTLAFALQLRKNHGKINNCVGVC